MKDPPFTKYLAIVILENSIINGTVTIYFNFIPVQYTDITSGRLKM